MSLPDPPSGLLNASRPLPWLMVSGQPTVADLTSLVAGGIRTVIDIRDPMEPRGFDEGTMVETLGARYINAPVISGALDDTSMQRALAALDSAERTPTLLHCNSANRTGGVLIAWLATREGAAEADAVDQAMRSGLRSVEVMEWATDFAARHRP